MAETVSELRLTLRLHTPSWLTFPSHRRSSVHRTQTLQREVFPHRT